MEALWFCFPLLGILFVFIVGPRFAMSHGEEWSTGELLSALVMAAIVAGALARAGFTAWLQLSFWENQTSKKV
jgi:hypothetical protein